MRIGIDISQIVHEGTGVGKYVREIVREIVSVKPDHDIILFGASLRKRHIFWEFFSELPYNSRIKLVVLPVPPSLLDIVWNRLHIIPVEWIIGKVDVFWSSDWTQPPLLGSYGITTIHDLTILRYPESFHSKILTTQRRRLGHVLHECKTILCDSEATKKDCISYLHIHPSRLSVVYPGFSV